MTTIAKLLLERAEAHPTAVATREFRLGIWEEATWADVRNDAATIGAGLRSLGVGRGDVVAIVAANGPAWLTVEFGALGLGASVLAVPPNFSPATTRRVVEQARPKVVVVGDQEQFDKLDGVDSIVIVAATRGLRHLDRPGRVEADRMLSVDQLRGRGSTTAAWLQSVDQMGGDDNTLAVTFATPVSGHVSLVATTNGQAIAGGRAAGASLALDPSDSMVVLRSFADPAEHSVSVIGSLLSGVQLHFGEEGLSAAAMHQVQPTVVHASAEWLNGQAAMVERLHQDARGVKRLALDRGLVDRVPASTLRTHPHRPMIRLAGLAVLAVVVAFLFATLSGNDVMRVLVVVAIVVAAGFALLLSGHGAAGPARRRLGLSRCRAVVIERGAVGERALGLLGALDVPVVALDAPAPAGDPTHRALASEVVV